MYMENGLASMRITLVLVTAVCSKIGFGLQLTNKADAQERTPKVVYASFTSSMEEYLLQLDAQVATWGAKPLAEGRYFCVGDGNFTCSDRFPCKRLADDGAEAIDFLRTDCDDKMYNLPCKMGYLFVEAAHRKADWVVVTQTDMYMNTDEYEKLLAAQDHTQPIAVGASFGCGKGGMRSGCDEVANCGGYCGGAAYAISGAALRQMIAHDEERFIEKMTAFTEGWNDMTTPEDMANSCTMWQAGVRMYMVNATYGPGFMNSIGDMEGMRARILDKLYSMHMVTPKTQHWIQAVLNGDDATRLQIEGEISEDGHCYECARETPPRDGDEALSASEQTRDDILDVPDGLAYPGDSCSIGG